MGWAVLAATAGAIQQPLKSWARVSTTAGETAIWANVVSLVLGLALAAVIGAAVIRAVILLAPEKARLRLGRDEAWLFVLFLQIVPILLAFSLIFLGLQSLFTALAGHAISPGPPVILALAIAVVGAGVLQVRLCLAGPMSVAHGRPRFLASWKLTRGRFWPILATLVLAALLALVVTTIGGVIVGIAELRLTNLGVARASASGALAVSLTPGGLAVGALRGLVSLLFIVIQAAPPAVIYRDLQGEEPADQAAVFD